MIRSATLFIILQGSVMGQVLPLVTARAIVSPLLAVYVRLLPARRGFSWHSRGWFREDGGRRIAARSEIPAEVIEQLVFGQVVQCRKPPTLRVKLFSVLEWMCIRCLQRQPRLRYQFPGGCKRPESLMAGTIRAGIAGGADSSPYCQLASVKNWRACWLMSTNPHNEPAPETLLSPAFARLNAVPPAVAEYSTGLRMGDTAEKWRKPTVLLANSKMH